MFTLRFRKFSLTTLFSSDFFENACAQFGIILKAIPTESHDSTGAGEGQHSHLRKIFKKIKIEYPTLSNSVCISLSVHALNSTATRRTDPHSSCFRNDSKTHFGKYRTLTAEAGGPILHTGSSS